MSLERHSCGTVIEDDWNITNLVWGKVREGKDQSKAFPIFQPASKHAPYPMVHV